MISQIKKITTLIFKSDLLLPGILLLTYIIFLIIARGVAPTPEELVNYFAAFYSKYGYEIIFLAAFLESLVLVNIFVPGQVAMALGAIFARTGQTQLTEVIIFASLGAISGYCIDYLLGYYGFSEVLKRLGYGTFLTEAKKQLKRFGNRGLILGFIHSNIGAFVSLTAGTLNIYWLTFISIAVISTFVWLSLWGILVYLLGDVVLLLIKKYSFLLVLIFISILLLSSFWKGKQNVRS